MKLAYISDISSITRTLTYLFYRVDSYVSCIYSIFVEFEFIIDKVISQNNIFSITKILDKFKLFKYGFLMYRSDTKYLLRVRLYINSY